MKYKCIVKTMLAYNYTTQFNLISPNILGRIYSYYRHYYLVENANQFFLIRFRVIIELLYCVKMFTKYKAWHHCLTLKSRHLNNK